MNSHGTKLLRDEDGQQKGRKTPELPKVRFHTGTRIHRDKEIRRVSEQTSPQVARAIGRTQRWDEGGGSSMWQQFDPPFSFRRGKRDKGSKER